eukprot:gene4771-5951_t
MKINLKLICSLILTTLLICKSFSQDDIWTTDDFSILDPIQNYDIEEFYKNLPTNFEDHFSLEEDSQDGLTTTAHNFQLNSAVDLYVYSLITYCPASTIKQWDCTGCKRNTMKTFKPVSVVYNDSTQTQGYVGYKDDTIYVSFRGSRDISSWVTNLKFLKTDFPCPGCAVHSGFYQAWTSVKDQVKTSITYAKKLCGTKCTNIIVTGHSLGGALGTLCMAEMKVEKWNFPGIKSIISYTFGSPRVGNFAFTSYFQQMKNANLVNYRVVNQHDMVSHVPTRIQLYHHVSNEVWFNSNSTYKMCDNTGEDGRCGNSVIGYTNDPNHRVKKQLTDISSTSKDQLPPTTNSIKNETIPNFTHNMIKSENGNQPISLETNISTKNNEKPSIIYSSNNNNQSSADEQSSDKTTNEISLDSKVKKISTKKWKPTDREKEILLSHWNLGQYPTKVQKLEIVKELQDQVTFEQVSQWFATKRKSNKKQL